MDVIVQIHVEIGQLPPWYLEDEGNNDYVLEAEIEHHWHKNQLFANAEITVSYRYSGEYATVTGYDINGDVVFERDDHDFGYAIAAVERER